MSCFLQKKDPRKCFVHLGRFGDLMIIMPAWKHLFDTTGQKPVVMVCDEFSGLFDGASYIEPWVMHGFNWFADVKTGRKIAEFWFDDVTVPKWWDEPGRKPPVERPFENKITLKHQGHLIEVGESQWKSFQTSQWLAAGFSVQQMMDWPLVFDRRDLKRESHLATVVANWKRPVVLYNFSGTSNACPFEPEIISACRHLMGDVQFVDLRRVRAERIYDLLGLYDRSLCLITGDTSTLHLANSSNVPVIALTADGGAGSIVKCNSVLHLRYSEVTRRVSEISQAIQKLYEQKTKPGVRLQPA